MTDRLVLVDSNSLIYRGYFAIPPLTTTKGELVNAVFGFASILLKAMQDSAPQLLAACFDLPVPTFRHERDATYKATRKPMPDDLRPQFERCKQFLELFGVPIHAVPGFEADDVIGTLARQAEGLGLEVLILSGDLDTLQLVTPRVKVMTSRQGFQTTVIYDEAQIRERYGLSPVQMIEFKALKGDPTDNIAGVPGVGDKTAAKLIAAHGDVEGVYADLARFTPKLRENLAACREQVLRSRELARIVTDVPVRLDLDHARRGPYDRAAVVAMFNELEFRSLIPRLPPSGADPVPASVAAGPAPAATLAGQASADRPAGTAGGQLSLGLGVSAPAVAPAGPPAVDVALLTEVDVAAVAARLRARGSFALFADVVEGRHPRLAGLGLAAGEEAFYLPLLPPLGSVPAPLAALLADASVAKSVHDAKTARLALRRAGADLAGVAMDTMVASYLVASERRQHLLDELARERLRLAVPALPAPDRKDPKRQPSLDERLARAGLGAVATERLAAGLAEGLERLELTSLFRDVELPLVDVLVGLEEAGVAIDVPYLAALAREFTAEVARIASAAHEAVGHAFAINSPKQLGELLFDELHLPRGRRTKTGWSTDAAVLEELRGTHPVVALALEYREVEKLRSTYAEGLGALVDPETGRVHTTFEQTVAATGRLSSRAPNLQNIPIRTALGRRIRRAFVAPAGRVLVAADYSQIELRVLAHMSQDPALMESFHAGADVHRRTAAAGFKVSEVEVTKEQRDVAKMLNFGIAYGMSDFGLAQRMGMDRREAAAFIDEYFKRYAQVRRYAVETTRLCLEQGYVRTLLGRRRYLPELASPNQAVRGAAERMAVNMPIQGTAADIMKIAMVHVHERLRDSGLEAQVVLQVHDELVVEVAVADATALAHLVRTEMAGAYPLDVPLVVDVRLGETWDDLRPVAA